MPDSPPDLQAAVRFRILVVDDDPAILRLLRSFLQKQSYAMETAEGGLQALELVRHKAYELILIDLKMPDLDGLETLRQLKGLDANPSVLMMTAHGTIGSAVEAMKFGADDFLLKPLSLEALGFQIERIREHRLLKEECRCLRDRVASTAVDGRLLSRNKRMQEILALVSKVAPLPSTVLIQGESGTGKELVAREIHYLSPRSGHRFMAVNCGVIPVQLLESELFGYERGAFTGAGTRKIGYFEAAKDGTILLDEISETSMELQVKLLRVIQEKSFLRVGGTDEVQTNARIIASTNKNLEEEVAKNRFRKDLYYRLNVIKIEVPPLRERREDISLLAYHFLRKYSAAFAKQVTGFAQPALEALMDNSWEGNVRELENVIERAVAITEDVEIGIQDIPPEHRQASAPPPDSGALKPFQIAKREFELDYLKRALLMMNGSVSMAARATRIPRQNLYDKLKRYGISLEEYR